MLAPLPQKVQIGGLPLSASTTPQISSNIFKYVKQNIFTFFLQISAKLILIFWHFFRFFGGTKFTPLFWHVIFPIFPHLRSPRGSILGPFSSILASLFRIRNLYGFYIAFGMDFDLIFYVFLMNFPFAHSPRTKPREACF